MKIKIYRWLDYNKWLFITFLGLLIMGYFISCKPTNHTDVQIHYKTDTTDTNANKGHN